MRLKTTLLFATVYRGGDYFISIILLIRSHCIRLKRLAMNRYTILFVQLFNNQGEKVCDICTLRLKVQLRNFPLIVKTLNSQNLNKLCQSCLVLIGRKKWIIDLNFKIILAVKFFYSNNLYLGKKYFATRISSD
jgi:hypothetical protein